MTDLLPHGCSFHSLKDGGEERILVLLEDLGLQLAVEVFGICGVDCGRLPDHTVEIYGHLGKASGAHKLLDDEHNLLRPSDCEDGDNNLSAVLGGLFKEVVKLLGCISTAGLHVVVSTVCGFHDHGLQSDELGVGLVEEPGLLVLGVTGERHIVESVTDVEVCDGRTEDVTCVV